MSIKEILVIGSGLSSAAFCDGYLEKNNNIEIISPFNVGHNEIKNTNIKKTLPIHINNKNIQYVNFFNEFLNLKQNDKVNIFGSLNKYGNSAYWGFGLDNYNKAELNLLIKKIVKY